MITSIHIENWRSHRESSFTFDSGVNALVGEMGSGKTSVFEALTYGLYGKTRDTQGSLSLDDIIMRSPREADHASVRVEFQRGGHDYTVSRTIERGKGTTEAKLREDGDLIAGPQTREVTGKVEQLLGIDFDLFTQIAYSEQNQLDFFLELPPSERKETIDQLLKIDRFEDARSNLVTLTNRVKDRHQDRKETRSTKTNAATSKTRSANSETRSKNSTNSVQTQKRQKNSSKKQSSSSKKPKSSMKS
ncbi:MAG: SMC family ATPase [Candidatus Nanohaloarchaea archaeon]|nr:SMC family ATPase [Candidatus Nanohaloarchaea archaeon]